MLFYSVLVRNSSSILTTLNLCEERGVEDLFPVARKEMFKTRIEDEPRRRRSKVIMEEEKKENELELRFQRNKKKKNTESL